jgi:asparagine synthase (glutamine-hydrolysing)
MSATFARNIGITTGTGGELRATPSFIEDDGVSLWVSGRPRFDMNQPAGAELLDSRTLLAAYLLHGLALPQHLSGTFAFAIADPRQDRLLLAIDRLGIETLCFAVAGDFLHFGSRADVVAMAKASNSGERVSASLDKQALFNYLYYHCIPTPDTVYRGVKRLLPGHRLVFSDGRVTVEPYWSPEYDADSSAALPALEQRFLATVKASVGRSIEGARQPGCFLSGGTDSSTVAGFLGAVTGAPAKTYSIGFDAKGFDEMSYARIASKHFGTEHHEYYITPADLVTGIPRIAAACDQPFGNSSVLPTYYCAQIAAADGVDRMLGGDGGDELFGGNTRYAKQRVFDYFDRAPMALQKAALASLAPRIWEAVPLVKKARSYVRQASVRMPDRMQTYNLVSRIGADVIFEPDFLAAVDQDAPIKAMRAWYERAKTDSLVNRMLAFDLKYTLTDNDLPKVAIGCGTAGVDVAFPFLDDAVVSFSEKLDPALKLRGFKLRWFFKHALREFLPAETLTKSKHGFGLPFGIWLGSDKALKALAFENLDSLKTRGIVRSDFIDRLRADLLSNHATYYGELVWVLIMLEQWLQAHAPDTAIH